MSVEKDYMQILNDLYDCQYLMLQPMDVRKILRIDTKSAYDLFKDESFPSILISGKNYIFKEKLIDWLKKKYKL